MVSAHIEEEKLEVSLLHVLMMKFLLVLWYVFVLWLVFSNPHETPTSRNVSSDTKIISLPSNSLWKASVVDLRL